MKYVMDQKFLSLADNYTIKNEMDEPVFQVTGKVFSIGDKLSFKDMQGNELAFISQKLLALKKTYEIYRNDNLFAKVEKAITFFKDKFTVDIPGPNDYEVTGDFLDHEYRFVRLGKEVAHVSKAMFSWVDSYGIDIIPGEDDVVILATAVVIDLVSHDDKNIF